MSTKREITKKYARGYGSESKKARGRMLDELAATTGIWLPKLIEHGEFGDDEARTTSRAHLDVRYYGGFHTPQ